MKNQEGFSEEEKAAMKARVKELRRPKKGDGEADVQAAFEEMSAPDRAIGERIHAIVKAVAPHLSSRTWYGMPAYANQDGKVICFFQASGKFKVRYSTLGFNEHSNLDEGLMWPTSYAILKLTESEEARITELVKQATS